MYAIKAEDGYYMRFPEGCYAGESDWDSYLNNADTFFTEEDAQYRIDNFAYGKWKTAKIVPIKMAEEIVDEPKLEPKFLFIANKPDSADYCKGCLMASYSSDCIIENMLSEEQVIKQWTDCLYKNMNLRCNEAEYQFYIFKDGVKVWGEYGSTWDGGERYAINSDLYFENFSLIEAQEKAGIQQIEAMFCKAKAAAELMQNADKAKKEKDRVEAYLKQQEADKERRRLEFEKLKKEFNE